MQVDVTYNSSLHEEIARGLENNFPNVRYNYQQQCSIDALTFIQIAIQSAQLLTSVLQYMYDIYKKNKKNTKYRNKKFIIEIKHGKKKLKINATNKDVDINKLVSEFIKNNVNNNDV